MSDGSARRQQLFQAALDLPASERSRFLDRECANDAVLRAEVETLLAHYDGADPGFLSNPVFAPVSREDETPVSVGPYRILRPIGEGGMGIVYEAEQEAPKRRIAIKVLRPGLYSDSQLRRFRLECDVLGQLSHPSIAQVYDAGTASVTFARGPSAWLPFMAMELIEGCNVLDHAATAGLDRRARLELFARICDAVEHAHQQAVIHRDLKPGNIMVDARGRPKILDFGVARVVGGEDGVTRHTRTGDIVGTVRYMSPEQLRGDPGGVDVRSDVYSLGVVLYELLSGQSPHGSSGSSIEEILRRVAREETPRVSVHDRTLRGDLDAITAMALAPSADDRYRSAAALAADLRRHLDGEPIVALGERAPDVLRRLVRRHRTGVAVAATVLLLVIASSVVAWTLYTRERSAQIAASERLWQSLLAQASDARASGRMGRRLDNLETLRQAAEIRPSIEVRDGVIAALAVRDVELLATGPEGVNSSIRGLAVADRAAISEEDGVTRIMTLPAFEETARLRGPGLAARILVFSADGRYLATKYHDRILVQDRVELWVWDLATGEPVLKLRNGEMAAGAVQFGETPAVGRWVAIAEMDGRVHAYSLETGKPWRVLGPPMEIPDIAVDPRGERLAAASTAGEVAVWELDSGRRTLFAWAPGIPSEILWMSDGTLLVGDENGTIHRWDLESGQTLGTFRGHQAFVHELDLSTDGTLLASTAWDNTTRLWDVSSARQLIAPFQGQALSGIGDLLLTRGAGASRLYRVVESPECRSVRTDARYTGTVEASIDDSGRHLLIVDHGVGVHLLDIESGRKLLEIPETGWRLAKVLEKRLLGFRAGALTSWPIETFPGRIALGTPATVWSGRDGTACLDPSGARLLVANPDGSVLVDVASGEPMRELPGHEGVWGASLDPTGRWAFVGARGHGSAQAWDLETAEVVLEVDGTIQAAGEFSIDGRLLLVTVGATLTAYEVGNWTVRYRIEATGRGNAAAEPVFSSDGRWMALAGNYDVRLYDVESGERLATLTPPEPNLVLAIDIAPDDRSIVALMSERVIHVWDLALIRSRLAEMDLDWE